MKVKMMFIPAPGKVNYTQAKAYCHVSLLSFMQNTLQKLVTKKTRYEREGPVPFIYNNRPMNQEFHTNCSTPCDYTHIQEAVVNRKLQLRLPRC